MNLHSFDILCFLCALEDCDLSMMMVLGYRWCVFITLLILISCIFFCLLGENDGDDGDDDDDRTKYLVSIEMLNLCPRK